MDDSIHNPPLITADLPGIGGRIKAAPEDFEVEEIPAYPPSGQGEFLYLWIEKRDMGAEYFQRQVANRLGVSPSEIGTAGLKDRHAVTRQWVSVPVSAETQLAKLEGDGIRVLEVSRHSNKLRPGHLHGNRFRIVVREVESGASLPAIVDRLRETGLPNFYGAQRFGRDGETLRLGLETMQGGRGPRNKFLHKLSLSAVQSALFNSCLAQRMTAGLLHRVLPGDVMAKIPFGGMFVAENVEDEQKRFDAREIVSAGPIFGKKTFAACGLARTREEAVLSAFHLSPSSFAGFGKLMMGTRRHNLVYVTDLTAVMSDAAAVLSFSLPAGSYATILLREVMKSAALDADDA